MTGRQKFENDVKTVIGKLWDYASGDGDDLDRAMRMAGSDGDNETDD